MAYKNGETPEVGDKVKCVDDATTSYYSYSQISNGDQYTVQRVLQGSKSVLVEIEASDGVRSYKASRFQLVRRANESTGNTSTPPKYVIVTNEGKVIGTCRDDITLHNRLQDLLLKNPATRYNVYGYVSTAKTQVPKVEFYLDKGVDNSAPHVMDSRKSTHMADDEPFTGSYRPGTR